jgi:FtsZ-interacting cell division protein YlmF
VSTKSGQVQSIKKKDALIVDLIEHADCAPVLELQQRFLKERSAEASTRMAPKRTVKQLLRAAEIRAKKRRLIEAKARAEEKARHERKIALAREKHLDSLVGREQKLWAKIDTLIAATQPKSYDQAVEILFDLRDLDSRGKGGDFKIRVEALRQVHAGKPSFINRLEKAGL